MSGLRSKGKYLYGGVIAFLSFVGAGALSAQTRTVPDFGGSGWLNENTFRGGELIPVEGSPPLNRQDPAHPFVPNNAGGQPTYRLADLGANPNVKQWAKDVMKKDNDEVIAGKIAYTARQSCHPGGVIGFDMFGFQPTYFLQEKDKVTMVFSGDQQVRHVYLNVPHSANVKPSWYGESVGRYEGDTLVIDTIGLNTKTFADNYRTPHTDKLHVTERWRIVEGDSILEVTLTVEDPDTYEKPWTAKQRFRRVSTPYTEEVCAEGNLLLFDYGVPKDDTPDF